MAKPGRKLDRKRVNFRQHHERDYTLGRLQQVRALLDLADINILNARETLDRLTLRMRPLRRANRAARKAGKR